MNIGNLGKKAAVILVALLLAITLVSCGGGDFNDNGETNDPNANSDNGSNENGLADEPSGAEEILRDYQGGYGVVNQAIEDFELVDLDGRTYVLSDLEGQIVFLNFWGTWCPPCREEMPHMQTFHDKYKDEDVIILAVNPETVENRGSGSSEDAERKAREFIDEFGYTFPVLLDPDNSVWAVYQQRGVPTNYIIDADGIIRYLKPGAFLSVEEMEAFLEAARISIDT